MSEVEHLIIIFLLIFFSAGLKAGEDPPVHFYGSGGSYLGSGIYCDGYPRPYIQRFGGPCLYHYPLLEWEMRLDFRQNTENPAKKYVDNLFSSAFLGSAKSQYILGWRYHKGKTVKQNFPKAYAWYTVADYHGHDLALSQKENLLPNMSDEEVEEGQKTASKLMEQIQKTQEQHNEIIVN